MKWYKKVETGVKTKKMEERKRKIKQGSIFKIKQGSIFIVLSLITFLFVKDLYAPPTATNAYLRMIFWHNRCRDVTFRFCVLRGGSWTCSLDFTINVNYCEFGVDGGDANTTIDNPPLIFDLLCNDPGYTDIPGCPFSASDFTTETEWRLYIIDTNNNNSGYSYYNDIIIFNEKGGYVVSEEAARYYLDCGYIPGCTNEPSLGDGPHEYRWVNISFQTASILPMRTKDDAIVPTTKGNNSAMWWQVGSVVLSCGAGERCITGDWRAQTQQGLDDKTFTYQGDVNTETLFNPSYRIVGRGLGGNSFTKGGDGFTGNSIDLGFYFGGGLGSGKFYDAWLQMDYSFVPTDWDNAGSYSFLYVFMGADENGDGNACNDFAQKLTSPSTPLCPTGSETPPLGEYFVHRFDPEASGADCTGSGAPAITVTKQDFYLNYVSDGTPLKDFFKTRAPSTQRFCPSITLSWFLQGTGAQEDYDFYVDDIRLYARVDWVEPPTVYIMPDGSTWVDTDINFTINATDIRPNSSYGVVATACWTEILDGEICPSQPASEDDKFSCLGWNKGFSGTVTCPEGSTCQKRICFYACDDVKNCSATFVSQVFLIDKSPPNCTLTATKLSDGSPYICGTWSNSDVRVTISCTDYGIGVSGIFYCLEKFLDPVTQCGLVYQSVLTQDFTTSFDHSATGFMIGTGVDLFGRVFSPPLSCDVIIDKERPFARFLGIKEGSWQQEGTLTISIIDDDIDADNFFSGALTCDIKIFAFDGTSWITTKPPTLRSCSSSLTITIGDGGDCPFEGENACRISTRVTDAVGWTADTDFYISIGPWRPYPFSATEFSPQGITLYFQDRSKVEEGFEIEHSSDPSFSTGIRDYLSASPGVGTVLQYTISSLSECSRRCFMPRALKFDPVDGVWKRSSLASPPSVCDTTRPQSPTPITVAPVTKGKIFVMWKDTSSCESFYRVSKRPPAGSFSPLVDVSPPYSPYPSWPRTEDTISMGETFCYGVSAVAGTADGTKYSFISPSTGSCISMDVLANYIVPGKGRITPGLYGDVVSGVLFSAFQDKAVSLSQYDLSISWQVPIVGNLSACSDDPAFCVRANPVVLGDRVIYATYDGWVYALRITDGAILWSRSFSDSFWASPTTYGANIFLVSATGSLLLLDTSGNIISYQQRAVPCGDLISSSPIQTGGFAYFGCNDVGGGYIIKVNLSDLSWSAIFSSSYKILSSPQIVGGDLVFTTRASVVRLTTGGTVVWQQVPGDWFSTSSVVVSPDSSTLYVGSDSGKLYAFSSAAPGTQLWSYTADAVCTFGSCPIKSTPLVLRNGKILFISEGGYVYVLNPNGTLFKKLQIFIPDQNYIMSPTSNIVLGSEVVFITSPFGFIKLISDDILSDLSPCPKLRCDIWNTGSK